MRMGPLDIRPEQPAAEAAESGGGGVRRPKQPGHRRVRRPKQPVGGPAAEAAGGPAAEAAGGPAAEAAGEGAGRQPAEVGCRSCRRGRFSRNQVAAVQQDHWA